MERCTSLPATHSKRRVPNGVRRRERSWPPAGAAVPEVFSVARARTVPWQSTQSISTAARGFAVQMAVAVAILLEVAVDAVHAFVEMDVGQVDGLLELLRVFEIDLVVVLVQPVAFAIVLEDGAVDPAVAVEIGELGLLVFGLRSRTLRRNSGSLQLPLSEAASGLRSSETAASSGFQILDFAGYMRSPSVSLSHHM